MQGTGNKRLVVTIAVGGREWGDMALNWALSVKAGLGDDSGIDVGLIHTGKAVKGIDSLIGQHFDTTIILGYKEDETEKENPVALAFELKTRLYDILFKDFGLAPYDHVLFIDADTMMLPGRSVTAWFDELAGRKFAAYTNDVLYYEKQESRSKSQEIQITRSRRKDDHSCWCEPREIGELFDLKMLPQTDASFLYFERYDEADKIFNSAQVIYEEAHSKWCRFKPQLYKGLVLSEMCFNIACGIHNHKPCPENTSTWRPVFFEAFSGPQNFYHVQQEYNAFGFAGEFAPSPGLLRHYNKLGDYYREFFGVVPKYHYVQKKQESRAKSQEIHLTPSAETASTPLRNREGKAERAIYGFWHVAIMGNWDEIVREQLQMLLNSGLYSESSHITTVFVGGTEEQQNLLIQILRPYMSHLNIEDGGKISKYEFPTLELLYDWCKRTDQHFGWYIHTKGVSDPRGKHWRDYLNYYNIERWQDAQAKLREGYDLCGVKLLQPNGHHALHYSGNFWHYDSEYIKQLASPMELDVTNRHQAEMWVCSGEPDAASLCQVIIDHEQKPPFRL